MSKKLKKIKEEYNNQLFKPKTSNHHIIPRVRGGSDGEENVVSVNQDLHNKYHNLFQSRTPDEILEFLVNYFWGGNYAYLQTFLIVKEEL